MKRPSLFFLPFILILLLAGCSTSAKVAALQDGTASWYGPGFHGKKTASGESYDQNKFTAAHKTLPIGTLVKVVNTKNGKSVVVRVNDRGPYVSGRILDVSKAAAMKLGMIQTGTAPVKLYVKAAKSTPELKEKASSDAQFTVQIASYSVKSQAEAKRSAIPEGWISISKTNGKTVFRVMSGKFNSKQEADKHRKLILDKGIAGFVKQVE